MKYFLVVSNKIVNYVFEVKAKCGDTVNLFNTYTIMNPCLQMNLNLNKSLSQSKRHELTVGNNNH